MSLMTNNFTKILLLTLIKIYFTSSNIYILTMKYHNILLNKVALIDYHNTFLKYNNKYT